MLSFLGLWARLKPAQLRVMGASMQGFCPMLRCLYECDKEAGSLLQPRWVTQCHAASLALAVNRWALCMLRKMLQPPPPSVRNNTGFSCASSRLMLTALICKYLSSPAWRVPAPEPGGCSLIKCPIACRAGMSHSVWIDDVAGAAAVFLLDSGAELVPGASSGPHPVALVGPDL